MSQTALWVIILLILSACRDTATAPPALPTDEVLLNSSNYGVITGTPGVTEAPVTLIDLAGPAADPEAEISSLAWFGDTLILLPQYPGRFEGGTDGALFALSKADILAYLDGKNQEPLTPRPIPFDDGGLQLIIPGFEGFEAVAFDGNHIFLNIESNDGSNMMGYLVGGTIAADASSIKVAPIPDTEIPPEVNLPNSTDESLFVAGDHLVTLFEANGRNVNPHPHAHVYDLKLQPLGTISFPPIEYRITDASSLDSNGRFWAINYFFPGDKDLLKPAPDPLAQKFGLGPTHSLNKTIERLVEFQYSPQGIQIIDKPPIQLELVDDNHSRNWEGLVRLDSRGFLLATDKYPETLLGFVPNIDKGN